MEKGTVPDAVEEMEVADGRLPYQELAHIDLSNPEHIFDFSRPYSSSTTASPPNTPTQTTPQTSRGRRLIVRPSMTLDDLLDSAEYKKEAEKKFPCDVCGRRFARSTQMRRHKRIHTGEKPYSCYICKRPFTRCDYLKSHIPRHRRDKVHQCFVCDEAYFDLARFVNHCHSHSDNEYLIVARIRDRIKSRKILSAKKVQNAAEQPVLASNIPQELQQPSSLPEDDSLDEELEESMIHIESIHNNIMVVPAVHPLHYYASLPGFTFGAGYNYQ